MKQGGHLLQHIDQGSTGKQFQIGQYLIITGTPCMNLFTGFPTLSGEEAFYLRMDVLYPRLYMKFSLFYFSEDIFQPLRQIFQFTIGNQPDMMQHF